jgi:hypothetical protein
MAPVRWSLRNSRRLSTQASSVVATAVHRTVASVFAASPLAPGSSASLQPMRGPAEDGSTVGLARAPAMGLECTPAEW